MSHILMVHSGGTLMMRPGQDAQTLEPTEYAADLLAELPVLDSIAEIDTRIFASFDSGDIQPHHWVELARLVHDSLDEYDGVIIVHGTDSMAYTASALAFLLPGLDRPVVLTGAQRPLFEVRSDARTNLVNACHVATLPVPEVGIAFGDRFYRGCRATKFDAWSLAAFDSPLCPPLVELGLGVRIADHVLPPRPSGAFDPRLTPKVLALRVFPGLDPKVLETAVASGVRGIVLEAFGSGNVPKMEGSLVPAIEKATESGVPVVVVSQCPRGCVDFRRYRGGALAERAGAISAGDMTTEAALTKLMVMLGRAPEGRTISFVRRAFEHPLLGEMTVGSDCR